MLYSFPFNSIFILTPETTTNLAGLAAVSLTADLRGVGLADALEGVCSVAHDLKTILPHPPCHTTLWHMEGGNHIGPDVSFQGRFIMNHGSNAHPVRIGFSQLKSHTWVDATEVIHWQDHSDVFVVK